MSQPSSFKIPLRTSSKRALSESVKADEAEKLKLDQEIKESRKKIKARGSFDAEYWADHHSVNSLELRRSNLRHKISKGSFITDAGGEEEWEKTEEAKTIREEQADLELKQQLFKEYSESLGMDKNDRQAKHRQWIMELMTASPIKKGGIGVGDTAGQGKRLAALQSEFKAKLQTACKSLPEEPGWELEFCPIVNAWMVDDVMRAAHISPYGAGQNTMDELFGRENEDRPEMFEIENGLIMCSYAESRIANGFMALVPDVPDNAPNEVVQEWRRSVVKQYKIRVICPDHKKMKMFLPGSGFSPESKETPKRWVDLNGQRVNFRSDHRPRARYLYWQFCVSLLRAAWSCEHRKYNPVTEQIGKQFWGSGGKWIRKKYLLGFAEYVGHTVEWERLMEAAQPAVNEEDNKPDPGGVVIAAKQISDAQEGKSTGPELDDESDSDGEDMDC